MKRTKIKLFDYFDFDKVQRNFSRILHKFYYFKTRIVRKKVLLIEIINGIIFLEHSNPVTTSIKIYS